MSEVRKLGGELLALDMIEIEVGVDVERLKFRSLPDRVVGTFESHVITTLIARDGRRYVGTDMTAEEIDEWEALLLGEGAP